MPMHDLTLKGVLQSLSVLYEMKEPDLLFISTTDKYRIAQRFSEQKNPGGALKYPKLFLHIVNMMIDRERINVKSLARHGVYGPINDNQNAVRKMTLVPTIYELEAIYVVDDFLKAMTFASQWLANSINNRLNFTLTYYGLPVDIRVEMVDSVSTPDRDEGVDLANHYEYVLGLKVFSYVQSDHADDNAIVSILKQRVTTITIDPLSGKDPQIWDSHRAENVEEY
jgi:hypothetical protein